MRVRLIWITLFSLGLMLHAQEADLRRPYSRPDPLLRAAGEQRDPATASDGRDFISVWADTRAGQRVRSVYSGAEGGEAAIFFNIIRAEGTAVSPYGIRISNTDRWCSSPAVVWSGSHYVVAWTRWEQYLYSVSTIRVSRDGQVLDPAPRTVFSGYSTYAIHPMLAASDTGVLAGVRTIGTLDFAAIAEDGTPQGFVSLEASTRSAALVSTGQSFLVAGIVPRRRDPARADVVAWPITLGKDGPVAGPQRLLVADANWGWLDAASRGGDVLLAYTAMRDDAWRVMVRVLRADGTASAELEASDLAAGDPSARYFVSTPSVSATRTGWLVAWPFVAGQVRNPVYGESSVAPNTVLPPPTLPTFDVHSATVEPDGRVSRRDVLVSGRQSDEMPSIASNGSQVLVSWLERTIARSVTLKIAAALSSGGPAVERVEIARSPARQQTPEIAAGKDSYLVVWAEERKNDGVRSIFARRFGRDGHALGGALLLSEGTSDQFAPKVAFDGEVFLVVWADDATPLRVVGRRVAADGSNLDAHARTISDGRIGGLPTIASNGRDFAVAYGSPYPEMRRQQQTAQVVRINRAFEITGRSTTYPSENTIESDVVIAASGEEYIVTWHTDKTIAAATLDKSLPRAAEGVVWYRDPLVSCGPRQCVAVSTDLDASVQPFHPVFPVHAATTGISIPSDQASVALTRNGAGHTAVWTVPTEAGTAIRARSVTADGEPASEEIEVATALAISSLAAASLDGDLAVAYTYATDTTGVATVGVKVVGRE